MNLVVDSNIVISALISPSGVIAKIIFTRLQEAKLYAPEYLYFEVIDKQEKIQRLAGYTTDEFYELLHILLKRLELIDHSIINEENKTNAFKLVADIDIKDVEYVALTLQTEHKLWTGDKALINGLKAKGFTKIIDTAELIKIIE